MRKILSTTLLISIFFLLFSVFFTSPVMAAINIQSLTVTFPNGGEIVSGTINIQFSATTIGNGGSDTATVRYSSTGCSGTFTSLGTVAVTGTGDYSKSWDTTLVSDGSNYCIQVDGNGKLDKSNAIFTVLNTKTCGISVSPSLTFGNLNPGDTSLDQSTIITNNGNNPTTVLLVSGTNWISGSYNFPFSQTKWSTSNGQNYDSMTALSSTPTDMGVDVSPGSPLTTYFKLKVPIDQHSGTYSQTITFTSEC
jgi:hypothetical protein